MPGRVATSLRGYKKEGGGSLLIAPSPRDLGLARLDLMPKRSGGNEEKACFFFIHGA